MNSWHFLQEFISQSFCPLPFRYAPVTVGSEREELTCKTSLILEQPEQNRTTRTK